MKLNSLEELYNKALTDLKGQKGVVTIDIAGIPKISKSNDIIGNCIQEWIPQWLEDNGLVLEKNEHSQCFPDFTANIGGKKFDMEVKSWNYSNNPAFDLANFDGFYREIYTRPGKLHAKYLIFGYKPTKHGFEIKDIYLKNLWEITSKSEKYPIGLQVKQKSPYAIRPFAFHKFPEKSFSNINELIKAVYDTRKMFPLSDKIAPDDKIDPDEWYEKVKKAIKK